jgi:hypothetical protein
MHLTNVASGLLCPGEEPLCIGSLIFAAKVQLKLFALVNQCKGPDEFALGSRGGDDERIALHLGNALVRVAKGHLLVELDSELELELELYDVGDLLERDVPLLGVFALVDDRQARRRVLHGRLHGEGHLHFLDVFVKVFVPDELVLSVEVDHGVGEVELDRFADLKWRNASLDGLYFTVAKSGYASVQIDVKAVRRKLGKVI